MFETVLRLPACTDRYKLHAWVSDRIKAHRDQKKYLFVADQRPDETLLSVLSEHPMSDFAAEPVAPLVEGSTVRFRVELNPVRKIGGKNRPVNVSDIPGWLESKMSGFAVTGMLVTHYSGETIKFGRGGKVRYLRVMVEGGAVIADVAAANALLLGGVGDMRGFGYGMVAVEGTSAFRILGFK